MGEQEAESPTNPAIGEMGYHHLVGAKRNIGKIRTLHRSRDACAHAHKCLVATVGSIAVGQT